MMLDDPRRFKVKLVDAEGRTNPVEPEIVVNVTRNRPPTVMITQPSHDVRGLAARGAEAQGQDGRRLRRWSAMA